MSDAHPRRFSPTAICSASRGCRRAESTALLDLADEPVEVSRQVEKKTSTLRGRTQINLFFEASTRTQSSFELAGKRLGADVMNMSVASLLGEEGRDADRHGDDAQRHAPRYHHRAPSRGGRGASAGAEGRIARWSMPATARMSIPTQALLDALTIRRNKGRIAGPDRRHLRRHPAFARGPLQHPAAHALGARVRVVAPSTLLPPGIERPRRRDLHRHAPRASRTPTSS